MFLFLFTPIATSGVPYIGNLWKDEICSLVFIKITPGTDYWHNTCAAVSWRIRSVFSGTSKHIMHPLIKTSDHFLLKSSIYLKADLQRRQIARYLSSLPEVMNHTIKVKR